MTEPEARIPERGRSLFGNDKGDMHVPGAGTMGMALLLVSLGMLFAASVLGYLMIRFGKFAGQAWPPAGYPSLPWSLWISTGVILATSITIQWALVAARRGNLAALGRALAITLGLGLLFLGLQGFNWLEIWTSLSPEQRHHGGPYIMLFYVLTGLHAAHVIGGLIPLVVVTRRAMAVGGARYSANYHPGVRYCAMYWHFLDAVWVALFTILCLV